MAEIITKHGADRILFASDCPWQSSVMDKELIERMPLNDEQKEKIFWKNAAELLELSIE